MPDCGVALSMHSGGAPARTVGAVIRRLALRVDFLFHRRMNRGIEMARRAASAALVCAGLAGPGHAEAVTRHEPTAAADRIDRDRLATAIRVDARAPEADAPEADGPVRVRPRMRRAALPHARWSYRVEAPLWTRAALSALDNHAAPLVEMVPDDIETWCPAYPQADAQTRAAFWVGFLSALTKHESTYRPDAVGGGGRWYGLMQILPATARGYGCRARSGAGLKNGADNLSCALRIMARTVPRDGVIHGYSQQFKRKWRGVSADWGPMRSRAKRADIASWLRAQSYCRPLSHIRPKSRPEERSARMK